MKKRIAIIAHDNMKKDMAEWVAKNHKVLAGHSLVCTGTTGKVVSKVLSSRGFSEEIQDVTFLKSGPLGGDQQVGALIADGKIDIIIFFCDPMMAQPHDVDVKALMRIASVYNVPLALNMSSADFIISSPYFTGEYKPQVNDYSSYIERIITK
ncbi:MAG: methylglyoxal synthase [Bacteroidetes bacterium]|nr:methylglyoxal synthase [Bacteroidota bacterium]